MPCRVAKPVSKKTRERHILKDLIKSFGVEMPRCVHCCDRQLECRFVENSSRCGECVRLGQSCDTGKFSASEGKLITILESLQVLTSVAGRLISIKKRLTEEEAEAEAANKQALQVLVSTQAKLDRILKERRMLEERAAEMIRRGFKDIEGIEEEERRLGQADPSSVFDGVEVDWNTMDFSMDFSSLGPADLGALSGTAGQVAGNVSSS